MNAKELGQQPANPCFGVRYNAAGDFTHEPMIYDGLNKLEAFTLAAMQGFCTQATGAYEKGPCNSAIATRAVEVAKLTLAELAKEVA